MNIDKDKLSKHDTYITHYNGYRIVYYYDNHHEAPFGLYAENISDFNKKLNLPENTSVDKILNELLKSNNKALGVAIYDINAKCIAKKIKNNVEKVDDTEVFKEELIYDFGEKKETDGYRIVYFYKDHYLIGGYCKTIEGFMENFAEYDPHDEDDIPEFISIDDLLERYLRVKDVVAVALYKVDGTCVEKKSKHNKKSM